jgi:hypothetical protein
LNRPFVWASGAPPIVATAGANSTSSRASRLDSRHRHASAVGDAVGRKLGEPA